MTVSLLNKEIGVDGSLNEIFYDESTNKIITNTTMQLDNLFEYTKEKRNQGNNGFTKSREYRQIGEIPMTEYLNILKEFNIQPGDPDEPKHIRNWLRRPENAYFRTCTGKF